MFVDVFRLGAVVLAAFALTSCKDSVPGEDEGRAVLQSFVEKDVNVAFEIASFEKTDGISRDFGGAEYYEMMFNATVEFPDGYYPECAVKTPPFQCLAVNLNLGRIRWVPVGGTVEFKDRSIIFEKRESGWNGSFQ